MTSILGKITKLQLSIKIDLNKLFIYKYILITMSDKNEEKKRLNEYKNNVSKIILKIYTDQQKIIDKLNIELIELKLILSQKNESYKIDTSDDSD